MDNVKVAVRVRPFNDREKERKSKCIISMKGNMTTIRNPDTGELKTFSFDFSYWSHCYSDPNFADQRTVFNDLGSSVLKNAWRGYNASLLAYGQTGASAKRVQIMRRCANRTAPHLGRFGQELQHDWAWE